MDMIDYNKSVSWGAIEDKVFVFDEETPNIYMFSNLTKDIWLMIDKEKDIDKLLFSMYESYGENVSTELMSIIDNLITKGLLIKTGCCIDE